MVFMSLLTGYRVSIIDGVVGAAKNASTEDGRFSSAKDIWY